MTDTTKTNNNRKQHTKRTIWGLAKSPELSLDKEELYSLIYRETGKEHMSELTQAEINDVVRALAALMGVATLHRKPQCQKQKRYDTGGNPQTISMRRKIYMLTKTLGWHEDTARINGLCRRMCGVDRVEWLSVSQCGKVIEGLKKMIERLEAEKGSETIESGDCYS